ncbi:hypothetical protein KKI24_05985 [bacterium]|nr:hypothetical protein [bacterium]
MKQTNPSGKRAGRLIKTRFRACAMVVAFTAAGFGFSGCSANTETTAQNTGTKKGCMQKFEKLGYQHFQAEKYCRRFQ